MIGKTLAHYEILGLLGKGGMGEVYRARDTRLGREVALKVLPAELAEDPERLERFRREARALAALDHPGIVTIHAVEEAAGVHFFTMEMVRGRALDEVLAERPVPTPMLCDLGVQLADALAVAHDRGVVHRDLKPANVMVSDGGRVKILDFGLAKLAPVNTADSVTELRTQAGVVMGTTPYMSPEQIRSQPMDGRSDIFSLGIILHEMAAGARPFQGDDLPSLVSAVLRDEPRPVSEIDPQVPAELAAVILRCLRKVASDRYQTARELRDALQRLQSSAAAAMPAAETRSKTVVVLPFVNRSGDPDNEYFSDGLTEEVIADLSRISSLRTISRNSAMTLKGTTKDSPTLARELGVSHLVTGSVRRAGNALRVTAELVDARTDTSVWSDKYSGTVEDVFGIQEEIARRIVAALQLQLTDTEKRKVAERPIADVVAYDCFLRSRQEMLRWTPDGLRRALRLVDEALAIVGDNPLLLATKGNIHWTGVNILLAPAEAGLARAAAMADRALALDPDLPLGVFLRGLVAGLRGQVEAALIDVERAHDLDPGDANITVELCRFANAAGLPGEAHQVERLTQIDPLSHMTPFVVSTFHGCRGNFAAVAPAARLAMERAPAPSNLHVMAAWQIAEAGGRDEAIPILERAVAAMAGTVSGAWARLLKSALEGDPAGIPEADPGADGITLHVDHWARTVADAYALLGRRDDALRWLRITIGAGFINYPCLSEHDPFLNPLRADPEFQQLMAELRPRWEAVCEWERQLR